MANYCAKCGGLLVQGTETCIICGKFIAHNEQAVAKSESAPASPSPQPPVNNGQRVRLVTVPGGKTHAIPPAAPIPPYRSYGVLPGPQIRFVTAPGGRRVEGSSSARAYKMR